jgi:hypothetical protein
MRSHCHFDRRPSCPFLSSRPEVEGPALSEVEWAAVERSGREPSVSGVYAKVYRRGRESFRPRGRFRKGATSDSRPDVSTSLDMTDRARNFPNPYYEVLGNNQAGHARGGRAKEICRF